MPKKITTVFTADETEALRVAKSGGSADEIKEACMASVKVETKSPNIAFVGEGKPLTAITAQGKAIELPKDQSKPFYHEQAGYIIRHFPAMYKPVVTKGDK